MKYADAGVNRLEADRFVEKIASLSQSTLNKKVKGAVGGYASLYELDKKRWLAASTDGVGTKLKLAFQLNHHSTVGIDLVAMSVNDLLCVGAEPLFFLDYFATGKLDKKVAEQVLKGIVEGCKQARCALVGGETAEMPDFYEAGEYDLAGFAVGFLNPSEMLPRKEIQPGDVLIGIASSGCHSNGFSLIRKLKPQGSLALKLLTPTRIYRNSLIPLIQSKQIKGLAHITGSGFLNVPRISEKVSYEIQLPPAQELPEVFQWIQNRSQLSFEEMAQTFNLGIGMIAVISPHKSSSVLRSLKKAGEKAWIVGEVTKRRRGAGSEVTLHQEGKSAILKY